MSTSSVEKRKLLASISAEPAEHSDVQARLRRNGRRPISSKAVEQLVAIEVSGHGATPSAFQLKSAPSPRISSDEAREARGDEGGVVDPTGCSLAEPHHQRRHGDAMVHVGRDHAAAGRAALAVHDQVVAVDLDRHAIDPQHRRRSLRADRIPSPAAP